jgi:hypothetical protein
MVTVIASFSPMTTQERINQLASAALRSQPDAGLAPKPATFMPSFERLKTDEFVVAPVAPAMRLQIGISQNAFDAAFNAISR